MAQTRMPGHRHVARARMCLRISFIEDMRVYHQVEV
jgi:hypothetical protein